MVLASSAASPPQVAGLNAAPSKGESRSSTSSQDIGEADLKVFLAALQEAVASDDRRKVASMIRYPIVVRVGGRSVLFKTPPSLVASYELVLTPRRKKLIAEAQAEQLSGNWQGVMIGLGDFWINKVAPGRLKIITINDEPSAAGKAVKPQAPAFKVHPRAFTLIECLEQSDPEYLAIEINLDAIAKNSNRFPPKEVTQDGEWTKCPGEQGGFTRYRMLKGVGNRFTVEFQDNGGGTLTESAIIEFVVDHRQVRKDGKLKSIRVLRVLAYTPQ